MGGERGESGKDVGREVVRSEGEKGKKREGRETGRGYLEMWKKEKRRGKVVSWCDGQAKCKRKKRSLSTGLGHLISYRKSCGGKYTRKKRESIKKKEV